MSETPPPTRGAASEDAFSARVLRDVTLRVWAEIGRATLPVGRAAGLGPGSVVELDRDVDEPVDVFANGRRIGTGRLLLVEDGEWAVRLEQVSSSGETPIRPAAPAPATSNGAGAELGKAA
jgi:flagellar motor switch protein FliN/FliY